MKNFLPAMAAVAAAVVAYLLWNRAPEPTSPSLAEAAQRIVDVRPSPERPSPPTTVGGDRVHVGVESRAFVDSESRPSVVEVLVVDDLGVPVADAYVYFGAGGVAPLRQAVPKSDREGRIALARQEGANLCAWHPGVGYGVAESPTAESVRIVLGKGLSFRLRASVGDGSPLSDVRVRLSRRTFLWTDAERFNHALPVGPESVAQFSACTDKFGVAEVHGLKPGRYFARIDHRSHVPTAPDANFSLELTSDAEQSVEFVPVEAVNVVLRDIDPADVRWSYPREKVLLDGFASPASSGMLRMSATLRARTKSTISLCAVRDPNAEGAPSVDLIVEPPGFESRRITVPFRPIADCEATVVDVKDFVPASNAAEISIEVLASDGSRLCDQFRVRVNRIDSKFSRVVTSDAPIRVIAGEYRFLLDDVPTNLVGGEQAALAAGDKARVALKARIPLARVMFDTRALGENPDGFSVNLESVGRAESFRPSFIFFGTDRSYWLPSAIRWRGDGIAGFSKLAEFEFETLSPGQTTTVALHAAQ